MSDIDWNDLTSFLAVAREGTLSGAAREAGVNQSTIGRRLQALHAAVGATLLAKTSSGYALTAAGERILAGVERMESEARAIERAVRGEDHRLEGLVRVTTVEPLGDGFLAGVLAEVRHEHPRLIFELTTHRRAESLLQGNSDISLRVTEFTEQDVFVRRVGEIAYGLYASARYLAELGPPDLSDGAGGHRVIRGAGHDAGSRENQWLDALITGADTSFRSNSWLAQAHAAEQGLGIVLLPTFLADDHGQLTPLAVEDPPVSAIWMGVHRDLRHVSRVKLAADCIAEKLRRRTSGIGAPSARAGTRSAMPDDHRRAGAGV